MKLNKPLLKAISLHLFLTYLTTIALLLVIFYIALPVITHHGEQIAVPNVVGISLEQAKANLKKSHLRFSLSKDSSYSSDFPPNTVMQQLPKAEAMVKNNRTIYLTLNTDQLPEVGMPDLVDGSIRNAYMILKSIGLLLGKITYVPDIAHNAILEQRYKGNIIKPGTPIAMGQKVDLYVGINTSKNNMTIVPNLCGITLEEAEIILLIANLKLGKVNYNSTKKPTSFVTKQSPEEGQDVIIEKEVEVWLD